MNLLLTDRLCCPRCGPDFGLILLADRVQDRRVLEGVLGCANCRERYPVQGGFADLRPPPRGSLEPAAGSGEIRQEEVVALAALLGITEGPAWAALLGPVARWASGLADLVDGLEVVAVEPRLLGRAVDRRVSAAAASVARLPFRGGSFGAVALGNPAEVGSGRGRPSGQAFEDEHAPETVALDDASLREALRVLAPGGRVVLYGVGAHHPRALEDRAVEVLLHEAGVLVARTPRPRGRSSSGLSLPVVPGSNPDKP